MFVWNPNGLTQNGLAFVWPIVNCHLLDRLFKKLQSLFVELHTCLIVMYVLWKTQMCKNDFHLTDIYSGKSN